MSELETLLPILHALSSSSITEPNAPMAVALQEANDLHTVVQTADTWERLLKVGVDPKLLDTLPIAVTAARQAQSRWVVVRDRSKEQAQREREQAAMELRADVVAACRWNLRDDPKALAVVDAVMQGEGIVDLIQDLQDLAALVAEHEAGFDADDTFDASAQAEAARSTAEELSAGLSESRTPGDHEAAKDLRDRAYSHLATLVANVREAGRYAFRKDPRRAAAFGSAYVRRIKARSRRRTAERTEPEVAAEPAASAGL
ncbi:hypothetical protein [Paraliomyxa miuraensis]|uniref:hypothetical protein n=1 Tax=Paraliomyxa miuraensis TaxID=376150 RepID=UPI002250D063|nr:hypothetical protein [Paraliomyxa miuraensis]MCX4243132.1 hypothetical protein [Paraliomyxa miuraensis]